MCFLSVGNRIFVKKKLLSIECPCNSLTLSTLDIFNSLIVIMKIQDLLAEGENMAIL